MTTKIAIPTDEVWTEPAQNVPAVADDWLILDGTQGPHLYRCEVRIMPEKEGGYSAYVAQLAGVVSQGDCLESATKNTMEALISCLCAYKDNDMPIPWTEPSRHIPGEESRWVEFNV